VNTENMQKDNKGTQRKKRWIEQNETLWKV